MTLNIHFQGKILLVKISPLKTQSNLIPSLIIPTPRYVSIPVNVASLLRYHIGVTVAAGALVVVSLMPCFS